MSTSSRRFAGLLILSLLLAACGAGGAPEAPPPPEVNVVTLQPETVTLTRELPGRTSAFLVAEVRPQVNGIVRRQLFTEGSLVKAGEPLYQIDDASYRALPPDASVPIATLAADRERSIAIGMGSQLGGFVLLVDRPG